MQSGFNGMINVDEQAISESKSSSMKMAHKSDKKKVDSQTSDEIYKVVHDFHQIHGNKIVGSYIEHQADQFNDRDYDTENDYDMEYGSETQENNPYMVYQNGIDQNNHYYFNDIQFK